MLDYDYDYDLSPATGKQDGHRTATPSTPQSRPPAKTHTDATLHPKHQQPAQRARRTENTTLRPSKRPRRTPLTGPAESTPPHDAQTTRQSVHASSPSRPRTGQSTSPLWSQARSEPRTSRQHPRKRPTRETSGLSSYLPPTAPLSKLPLQEAGAGVEQTIEAPSPPPTPSCRSLQPPSISNKNAPPPAPLATLLHNLAAPVFSPLPP